MGERGPKLGQTTMPVTPERRETFLRVLRETGGNWSAACRAASPHLDQSQKRPGFSTWKALAERDPAFAAQVEEVRQEIRDTLEAELYRRAVHGVEQAVYQKGMRVYEVEIDEATGEPILDREGKPKMRPASITRYSDTALLRRLAAELPEKYAEKRTVDVNHRVNRMGAWQIGTEDLAALSPAQKDSLFDIMTTIRAHRANLDDATAKLEDQRQEAIEVAYEEVGEGEYQGQEGDVIPW